MREPSENAFYGSFSRQSNGWDCASEISLLSNDKYKCLCVSKKALSKFEIIVIILFGFHWKMFSPYDRVHDDSATFADTCWLLRDPRYRTYSESHEKTRDPFKSSPVTWDCFCAVAHNLREAVRKQFVVPLTRSFVRATSAPALYS